MFTGIHAIVLMIMCYCAGIGAIIFGLEIIIYVITYSILDRKEKQLEKWRH
jgi:phage shock protein PspC (stress-responsive transcriptional regulator)